MPNNNICFEAQTGIIRDEPSAVSNFYQYAIPVRHRAELEEAIAAAAPGGSELQYAPGFLRRLDYWESEAKGGRTYFVEGFGLIGEADLFIPNFSQFITMAGEEQWQDVQLGDTFEGTAFDKWCASRGDPNYAG